MSVQIKKGRADDLFNLSHAVFTQIATGPLDAAELGIEDGEFWFAMRGDVTHFGRS